MNNRSALGTYHGYITHLKPNEVFVFGSNPHGNHGAGTAKIARERYGAIQGQGRGLMGQSYGLVTKNLIPGYTERSTGMTYFKSGHRSLTPHQIINNIREMYRVADEYHDVRFLVAYTADGRNLNGYTSGEMAKMFVEAGPIPHNVIFEDLFFELMIAQ